MPPYRNSVYLPKSNSTNDVAQLTAKQLYGRDDSRDFSLSSEEPTCLELYGPYPSSIPIPTTSDPKNSTVLDSSVADTIDYRDRNTPDDWIPRDGQLIRLTGRHPFNVEPPLCVHKEHPFITPAALHYVRNHGAVPKLTWEDHRLKIGGQSNIVSHPCEFTMDELASMEYRELPVTLVCAGNRRKEQNMIRQTIGFNWGAAGVSTNVWRGVPLCELLRRAGVSDKNMAGKHVEFIGFEDLPNKVGPGPFPQSPWGKLVKYGTSIPLARAMNPAYDVIIAYEANGELLQPDHGFPVRLIVPGYIGGRMIKWLAQINVLEHETTNHYHYHDNRILPPQITAEESLTGGWWYKPEYIFNELNINSAMTSPDHNETLDLVSSMGATYEVGGYAYTGGGRRITRVEVTTDGGIHWDLATIHQVERPTEYGMYWCWIHWTYDLKVSNLVGTKEVWCRAWDEANNCQPTNPTWNLMGMGNNQVFRVKVHLDLLDGRHVFRFEHPTRAGQQDGGWMTLPGGKPESAGFGKLLEQGHASPSKDETQSNAVTTSNTPRLIKMEEVRKHSTEDDVWIVVNNKVYNCTEYLDLHPGGADSILINAGEDATEDFVAIHSTKATKMLEKFYVGDLDLSTPKFEDEKKEEFEEPLCPKTGRRIALDPKRKQSFTLQAKTVLSRDSFELNFSLQSPEHVLGLPTGKHVFLSAEINGEMVMRRYTPITSDHDIGHIKFVIKAYPPCERFPLGGKMSQYLDALKVGDTIDMRGPVGEFDYHGNGNFVKEHKQCHATHFNMIAGGTGITPVMQIASEILRNPLDRTTISLIFACREEGDLLLRSTLEDWAVMHVDRFRVHYILSENAPIGWTHSTGFVSKKLFEEHLYPADSLCYNLMCGPPIMLERGCTPNLKDLGHVDDNIFSF